MLQFNAQTLASTLTWILTSLPIVLATDTSLYSCSPTRPCEVGCCGKSGICGLGPTFCGAGNCTSSCDQKSECDPGWVSDWSASTNCPLNVCCSKYGFCGTTNDFCGDQKVKRPTCSAGSSSSQRVIGYYEGWAPTRACDVILPEDMPYQDYTHINYAFAYIDPEDFTMSLKSPDDEDLMKRLLDLKLLNPDLKVWISIGGWAMNDASEPTAKTFSELAASPEHQGSFLKSLLHFMTTYGFDGVDIDWEYPGASDRSGQPQDYENFVSLLQSIREAFRDSGDDYGLSITLPSSYWYMKYFDVVAIEPLVDWFNMMTYDLHGVWDSTDENIGSLIYAHTNLTEIDRALDLLWRNDIDPNKVVMGVGYYGRSFTLSDPACTTPGCPFSAGGRPGTCTESTGTLSWAEIERIRKDHNVTETLDEVAAVEHMVWDNDQWVSYDDEDTLKLKIEHANSLCLGGVMVWAATTDSDEGDAARSLSSVNGRSDILFKQTALTPDTLTQCIWGECAKEGETTCPVGLSPAQRSDHPSKGNVGIWTGCPKGQQRPFCCPKDNVPKCQWVGTAPWCAHSSCSKNQVAIASSISGVGETCTTNHKNLCCDITESDFNWGMCEWTGYAPECAHLINSAPPTLDEVLCPKNTMQLGGSAKGAGGEQPCAADHGYKSLCCSMPAPWRNCAWHDGSDDDIRDWPPRTKHGYDVYLELGADHKCKSSCPAGKVPIAAETTGCAGDTSAWFCCDRPTNDVTSIPMEDVNICTASLHAGQSPGICANDDPDDPWLEMEAAFIKDCFIPGVPNSGISSGNHEELRRFAPLYGNTTLSWDETDPHWAVLEGRDSIKPCPSRLAGELLSRDVLEKRGLSRGFSVCDGRPGRGRGGLKCRIESAAYPTVAELVRRGRPIFHAPPSACMPTQIIKALQLPPGVKMVAEHLFELQTVPRFIQSLKDNVLPGKIVGAFSKLPWKIFKDQTSLFFQTAATSFVSNPDGLSWSKLFMSKLGTNQPGNQDNLFILDSETNNLKTQMVTGVQNIISDAKWKAADHLERLRLMEMIYAAVDYYNTQEAQTSLASTYSKLMEVCEGFQKALQTQGITLDVPEAFFDFMAAQYAYQNSNLQSFLRHRKGWFDKELTYWKSSSAVKKYSPVVAQRMLVSVQSFKAKLPKVKIKTDWITKP